MTILKLTAEDIHALKGIEEISEEDIEKRIESIKELALLIRMLWIDPEPKLMSD